MPPLPRRAASSAPLPSASSAPLPSAPPLPRRSLPRRSLPRRLFCADHFRAAIDQAGAKAAIPSSRSRARRIDHDPVIYKERNLVERFFNKAKHFRRIATRYEQTARAYLSMIQLVAAAIWSR